MIVSFTTARSPGNPFAQAVRASAPAGAILGALAPLPTKHTLRGEAFGSRQPPSGSASGVGPVAELVPLGCDEFMSRLGSLPLAHHPGETFMYHTGDDVLRVLISRIADQPLGEFLRERVFEPLGMVDSGLSVPKAKRQ